MFLNKRFQNQAEKTTQKVGFSPHLPKTKILKMEENKTEKF